MNGCTCVCVFVCACARRRVMQLKSPAAHIHMCIDPNSWFIDLSRVNSMYASKLLHACLAVAVKEAAQKFRWRNVIRKRIYPETQVNQKICPADKVSAKPLRIGTHDFGYAEMYTFNVKPEDWSRAWNICWLHLLCTSILEIDEFDIIDRHLHPILATHTLHSHHRPLLMSTNWAIGKTPEAFFLILASVV